MGYILYLSKEEQRRGEAFNASACLLFLHSACADFTLIPPNPIWNAANATAGQTWPEGGNNKEKRRIKNHHLSHGISLQQFLDERLAPFIKSPPQSQSSSPRKFKFRSPMYHSCIISFNFHCSLTEGQINVVHLSCTNQRHKGSKGSTFNRTFISARQSSHGKLWLPDSSCTKHMCCSRISCLQRWLCWKGWWARKTRKEHLSFALWFLSFLSTGWGKTKSNENAAESHIFSWCSSSAANN